MFKYIWSTGEGKDDAERYNLLATNIDLCAALGKVVDCSTDEKRAAAMKFVLGSLMLIKVDSARLDYLERLVSRQRKIIKLVSLETLKTNTLNLTGNLAVLYQNNQLLFIKKWSKLGAKEYHVFGECHTQRKSFKKLETIENKELGSVCFVIESTDFQYDFATEIINITSWGDFNNDDMKYDEELSEEEEVEDNVDDNMD
ncbi:hypothetical protein BV898_18960 [Hypsibius exemplaris]|uniref:Uncharacterized protein n=1 Tax=Hypsibius exemplaris TaxID=2072580 RepID=A0A9X6RNZ7_HYPEX|nr:hypothetical protein BV898_18960 [Hypsibius exemplaris]